ncbi:MAG: hypothetical protein HY875_10310 [Chloroflexi bacterium]|nr:hypothetical protein [Chloroflexota bacterium]
MSARPRLAAGGLAVVLAAAMVAYALAQQGGIFDAHVSGPSGGGARSTGGQFALEGVIGQPFFGTSDGKSGGGPFFSLDAGLLGGVVKTVGAALRIPLVAKD